MIIKITDVVADHPKLLDAGPAAGWLWVCGLAYCNRHKRRGGFIPAKMIRHLYPMNNSARSAAKLVEVGLWETVAGGYRVVDRGLVSYSRDRISAATRRQVIAEQGLVCRLCGGPVDPDDVHIDHITPVSRGGGFGPANLQVTHSRCNTSKGNRT